MVFFSLLIYMEAKGSASPVAASMMRADTQTSVVSGTVAAVMDCDSTTTVKRVTICMRNLLNTV
jgi:hypothetical protein